MSMSKRVMSVVVLLVLCLSVVLAGCGSKEVTAEDIDRVCKFYFDKEFGDEEYTITEGKNAVVLSKEAYIRTATGVDSGREYSIAIATKGSNVYSYEPKTARAFRIGGTNVG